MKVKNINNLFEEVVNHETVVDLELFDKHKNTYVFVRTDGYGFLNVFFDSGRIAVTVKELTDEEYEKRHFIESTLNEMLEIYRLHENYGRFTNEEVKSAFIQAKADMTSDRYLEQKALGVNEILGTKIPIDIWVDLFEECTEIHHGEDLWADMENDELELYLAQSLIRIEE